MKDDLCECGHPYDFHDPDPNIGGCSAHGCGCRGFVQKELKELFDYSEVSAKWRANVEAMTELELKELAELQRVAWIYARLAGKNRVRIRLQIGTEEGLGPNHPNLGKWTVYLDIGEASYSGTVVSVLAEIRQFAKSILGPGYL